MKCHHIWHSLKPKVDARGRGVMVQNVNAEPNSLPVPSKHFHHEPEKIKKYTLFNLKLEKYVIYRFFHGVKKNQNTFFLCFLVLFEKNII